MRKISSGVLMIGICFFLGCASVSKSYAWKDVTRVVEPTISTHTSQGHLVVYTERLDESTSEDVYSPYSPYTIYTAEGKQVKRVENHSSREDRYPEQISLAPGRYVIVPDKRSKQIVGAIIESYKATEVRLEGIK